MAGWVWSCSCSLLPHLGAAISPPGPAPAPSVGLPLHSPEVTTTVLHTFIHLLPLCSPVNCQMPSVTTCWALTGESASALPLRRSRLQGRHTMAISEGGTQEEREPSALLGRHSSLPFPDLLHQQVLKACKPIFKRSLSL